MSHSIQLALIHSSLQFQQAAIAAARRHADVEVRHMTTASDFSTVLPSKEPSQLLGSCDVQKTIVVLQSNLKGADSLKIVQHLRKQYAQLPILMCGSQAIADSRTNLKAVSSGATSHLIQPNHLKPEQLSDWIITGLFPVVRKLHQNRRSDRLSQASTLNRADLLNRVQAARQAIRSQSSPVDRQTSPEIPATTAMGAIVIASSTGGVAALKKILSTTDQTMLRPIVIVQHMLASFSGFTVHQLNQASAIPVVEAAEGESLLAGHAYFAPGGRHTVVEVTGRNELKFQLTDDPPVNSCRPAADVLFQSAAQAFGARLTGIVLTGMGQDGTAGCRYIKAAGGKVWAQDEASSVVWGMPKAVVTAGLADDVLSLSDICQRLKKQAPVLR